MNAVYHRTSIAAILGVLLVGLAASAQVPRTMSYQGVLAAADGGVISDGPHVLIIALYNALQSGSALYDTVARVETTGGLFSMRIGPIPEAVRFDRPVWLGISVDGSPELTPRIELTASPYAMNATESEAARRADRADTALHAIRSDRAVQADNLNVANARKGDLLYFDGAAWRPLDRGQEGAVLILLDSIPSWNRRDAWTTTGNSTTDIERNFLGTTDAAAFEIHVDHGGYLGNTTSGRGRVVRFVPGDASPVLIAGYHGNRVPKNSDGAVVLGGGATARENLIDSLSSFAAIVGGSDNRVADSSEYSSIGGGRRNLVDGTGGVIAGGGNNTILAAWGSVSGGGYNSVWGRYSAVGGGDHNRVDGRYSAVLGGRGLHLTGSGSIGFLGGNEFGSNRGDRAMNVDADNIAMFGNVDLWLANNNGEASGLRFYEPHTPGGTGDPLEFPGEVIPANYLHIEAQQMSEDVIYRFPANVPFSTGRVLGIERIIQPNGQDPRIVELSWVSNNSTRKEDGDDSASSIAPSDELDALRQEVAELRRIIEAMRLHYEPGTAR